MSACPMCRFNPAAELVAAWHISVDSYVPTVNSIGTNSKNNNLYRWWRGQWEKLLGDWLRSIPPATKYRRVTITRYYGKGKRPFDRKNFEGGCKPLLDTITNFGAIYDDSEMWVGDYYQQKKSPDGQDRVEVKIEELCQCSQTCPHTSKTK